MDTDEAHVEFSGTRDIHEALRLAREGWPEGTKAVAKALDITLPFAEECLPEWTLQAAGVMPCIPAFLSADPECMWQRQENLRSEHRVTLLIPHGYQGDISAGAVMNYGTAVTAIVRSLEAGGVSPAIWAVQINQSSQGDVYCSGVIVRAHGDPLDLAKVAVAMHPCFSRRLGFAYREQSDGLAPVGRAGYGLAARVWQYAGVVTPEAGIKIVMPAITELNDRGLLSSHRLEALIEYMRRHVENAVADKG